MRYRFVIPVFMIALALVFKFTTTGSSQVALAEPNGCQASNLTGLLEPNDKTAFLDGHQINVPDEALAESNPKTAVLGVADPSEKWIEVDLSEQKLRAWQGNTLYLETLVSTGLPGYDTPIGTFHIWIKLRATKMEGGSGRLYYYLPNVPYVMFFSNDQVPAYKGFSLHGTYWHNDFGKRHSHGCVNLPTPIAEKLYWWTTPTLPSGKSVVYSDSGNPGTRIVIHE